jgi:phosphoglycerate-specific signal transduction histidine kinase
MQHEGRWLERASLTSQRSRYQLQVAVALVVVIPMLAFCLIGLSLFTTIVSYSPITQAGVMLFGVVSGLMGYSILRRYPANIERLRDYLQRIAVDDLPDEATLLLGEQDMSDIEQALNDVIQGLQGKIKRLDEQLAISRQMLITIEKQSEEIIEAEQQRVMIESLGAACHHLGQPATVLSLYLSRLRDLKPEVLNNEDFEKCSEAVNQISDILKRLMHVSEYRTIPYATYKSNLDKDVIERSRIVDIDNKDGSSSPDDVEA